ncbi:Mrp/NBP35 family ATP-binding protein [Helicobacter ailurogastricus]|uniref:Iron-sulfur cluster carrier protein n=1 Tax=Helicobacter ailurogastricus TaxID=1578720 RepID=A0A0K2XEE2_9HELI|nr:Mrp/NBP35 family ATP-binding protein [Helicobacter ailurogastricus]CRF40981.1 Scaffold protein for [4Fe-4S] cluster assembly ApbC, MRP-like [Helicobacter ailurogastricus]CRF42426.1 Scaffold protein for [4Fe-4S] cluster assembly ApbC, MRP-like [Helicobacter ailurogastricus]CRF44832.1 Scaffold protein for [4Fe-4S] cluster assembly ApbC, MRP-like [Helicobacter ailurogastricus]
MVTQDKVLDVLKKVIYPNFERDIVSFGFVKNITLHENKLALLLDIPSSSEQVAQTLRTEITTKMQELGLTCHIDIKTPAKRDKTLEQATKNLAPNIKHVVMISSGKGGVGKSTTSVNLAISLAGQGQKVGLLDADVYGPNVPRMLGLMQTNPTTDPSGKRLIPLEAFGVRVMSMGLLYEEGQSLIWRGPMLMRAIEQMLTDIIWGELDILVVDMPPGTGDAQLTLAQAVPISAGLTVTTPQTVSLDDASRSLDMFSRLQIPIAGIVENMSGFICPNCAHESHIFGKDTLNTLAKQYKTQVLAQIPLEVQVREGGDSGMPISVANPKSVISQAYNQAASKLLDFLSQVAAQNLADNKNIQPTIR